jgi:hypothetical protein
MTRMKPCSTHLQLHLKLSIDILTSLFPAIMAAVLSDLNVYACDLYADFEIKRCGSICLVNIGELTKSFLEGFLFVCFA